MKWKCIIGKHNYSKIFRNGGVYSKECLVCGKSKIISKEKVEEILISDLNRLQILFDLSRHFKRCHNRIDAKKTILKTLNMYQSISDKYIGYYSDSKKDLDLIFQDIIDFKNELENGK